MSADPSSVLAAAERVEDTPPPPTPEELAAQQLEAELERARAEQREEDREASWPDAVRLKRQRRAVERASRALLGGMGATADPPTPPELGPDQEPGDWLRAQL
jgi:Arc/MetJ family transcription regulator